MTEDDGLPAEELRSRVPIATIERALGEARRRGENYLAPEHLLIAVSGAAPFRRRGLDAAWLRSAVERVMGVSAPLPVSTALWGTSSSAFQALQRAASLANAAGRSSAAEDDLLLALLDAPVGEHLAAEVLRVAGLDVATIRADLRAIPET